MTGIKAAASQETHNNCMIRNHVALMLVICVALSIAGCGTMRAYEGAELSDEETALIKSSYINPFNYSVIRSVDGKELAANKVNVIVMPGFHYLMVDVSTFEEFVVGTGYTRYSMGSKILVINAQAGHVYQVHGIVKGGSAFVWITDKETGHVVAGRRY